MGAKVENKIGEYQRLAGRPERLRRGALFLLAILIGIFVVGYLWSTSNPEFKMKGLPPKLSTDVSAVIEGYSRVEVAPDGSSFTVRAETATTFTDNHQRLDGVEIEFPGSEGFDVLKAKRALFIPEGGNSFKLFLENDVYLETATGLSVRSSAMVFDNATSIGKTEGPIEFQRGELKGSAAGAVYNSSENTIDLLGMVSVKGDRTEAEDSQLNQIGVSSLSVKGDAGRISTKDRTLSLIGNVSFNSKSMPNGSGFVPTTLVAREFEISFRGNAPDRIVGKGGVKASFPPNGSRAQSIEVSGSELIGSLSDGDEMVTLSGGSRIQISHSDGTKTDISARAAGYRFEGARITGEGAVRFERVNGARVQTATAGKVEYSSISGEFSLTENVRFDSEPDYFMADRIRGKLDARNELKSIVGEGNAVIGKQDARSTSESRAPRFEALFSRGQILNRVLAAGPSVSTFVSKGPAGNSSKVQSPRGMNLEFDILGRASNLVSQGRTTVTLEESNGSAEMARTLTADSVTVLFDTKDQSVRSADAKGKAEILLPEGRGVSTMIKADGFVCSFRSAVNRVERCESAGKANSSRNGAGDSQSLDAGRMALFFKESTAELELIQADRKARFSQGESNGTSEKIDYRPATGIVTLSGAPVQFWDTRGRSRSKTVEWDTVKRIVTLDGEVSTTYFNQSQLGGAVPFRERGAPVYVTANQSRIRIADDSVAFFGKARVWQRDNFISGETVEIQRAKRTLTAAGAVRTQLFDISRNDGVTSRITVSGTANSFRYADLEKTGTYEGSVDLRQGAERVQGDRVVIKLGSDGQVESFNVKGDVVLSQPGRRASGDEALYTVSDRRISLKGSPARVSESGRGAAEGGSIVYFLDDRRVVGEGRSERDPAGRVRSVYQVDRQ
jgi:lipopolysaccharide transport protein LptA